MKIQGITKSIRIRTGWGYVGIFDAFIDIIFWVIIYPSYNVTQRDTQEQDIQYMKKPLCTLKNLV